MRSYWPFGGFVKKEGGQETGSKCKKKYTPLTARSAKPSADEIPLLSIFPPPRPARANHRSLISSRTAPKDDAVQ